MCVYICVCVLVRFCCLLSLLQPPHNIIICNFVECWMLECVCVCGFQVIFVCGPSPVCILCVGVYIFGSLEKELSSCSI